MSEFTITGRNLQGEPITEIIPDESLTSPCEGIIEYVTREQYASIGQAFIEITRRQTFNRQMEELGLACGKLGLALMEAWLLFVIHVTRAVLRFMIWING